MTHRQFSMWQVWLEGEWHRPNRSDYYAMRTALEVRRVLMSNPNLVQIKDMKVRFDFADPEKVEGKDPGLTKEQLLNLSKGVAIARAGGKFKEVRIPRSEWAAHLEKVHGKQ